MSQAAPEEFFAKRRILYGKGAGPRQAAAAADLLRSGRISEALEYLERTLDRGMLEEACRAAVAKGDAFALQRASQILKRDPAPDEWRALARKAEADGRHYEAIRALEKAGDAEAAEALRLQRHPDYVPFKPAGK